MAWHFTEALTTDPDVTAHAIRGAREFGWDRFLTWPHVLATLPLADDAAFERVCGEVERTDEAAPSENLKGHLARMLVKAEIGLVERHRARLLAIPGLRPRERQTLITRLDLAACPPDEAWRLAPGRGRAAAGALASLVTPATAPSSRSISSMKILVRAATAAGRSARKPRNLFGTEITHCRTGTGGIT